MKPQITAVLIDSDANSNNRIQEILRSSEADLHLLASCGDLQEAMKTILASTPHIIILEVKDAELGAREIEFLLSRTPHSSIFVTSAEKSTDWILRLIRAGASEYLTRPVEASELLDAVKKVARLQSAKSGAGSKRGEVISVYNPSGGVGTTTIAVNLAATLAAQGSTTALVDLNLFSGDVSAFLDLAPRYTLASIMAKAGEIDASFLRSIIVHHSSGVQVLDGPENLGEASRITPELVQEVISVLRTMFDYTIIDTGGQLFGCNLAAFDQSDQILFTTVLSVPALRIAKRYLSALSGEGFGPGRVKLLVNRHIPKDEIKVSDAEKVLGATVYHALPNSFADVRISINKGVPLVLHLPKAPFSKAMEQLARQICQDVETAA
jgi:pilus assembly protein CpaE